MTNHSQSFLSTGWWRPYSVSSQTHATQGWAGGGGGEHPPPPQVNLPQIVKQQCSYLLFFLLRLSRFKFLLHFFDKAKCVVEVCRRGDCLTRVPLHWAAIRAEIWKNIHKSFVLMPTAKKEGEISNSSSGCNADIYHNLHFFEESCIGFGERVDIGTS